MSSTKTLRAGGRVEKSRISPFTTGVYSAEAAVDFKPPSKPQFQWSGISPLEIGSPGLRSRRRGLMPLVGTGKYITKATIWRKGNSI